MLGLHLNDRALALARDGEPLGSEPSAWRRDESGLAVGIGAWRLARRLPAATSVRHLEDVALHRADATTFGRVEGEFAVRLAEGGGGPAWVAAPQRFDARALGELLGLLRAAGTPVAGFVDAAPLVAAWYGVEEPACVLDLGLHRSTLSLVRPHDGSWSLRRAVTVDAGLLVILERWLALAAELAVARTRFDPLFDAAHEQQLFDELLPLASVAERTGGAELRLSFSGREVALALARDQLVEAAAAPLGLLAQALRDLSAGRVGVLLPRPAADLPGLADALRAAGAGSLHTVPDSAVAQAASLLTLDTDPRADSVRHLQRLGVAFHAGPSAPLSPLAAPAATAADAQRLPATHVLHAGRAWPIGEGGLVLGRDPAADGRQLQLPEGIAGLSRRHCTLWRQGGATVLVDHSTHGTFVDGERVTGRAPLHAGSVLRLGSPGIELPLIAV